MLDLNQIEKYYPSYLRTFKQNIVREYLQYKILEIIFNSKFSERLSFLGGTALRILYDNTRFSENLDFDNFDFTEDNFFALTSEIKQALGKQGYEAEMSNVFKGAYRCCIKLPKILYDAGLSRLENEKIMIQIDTAPHDFNYKPDKKIINKFDVFTQINSTPLDILLAQKMYAVLNRKRPKGRDFFDITFLLQKTNPNYLYLKQKVNVKNSDELKQALLKHIEKFDFNQIVKDVKPFLFNPSDRKRIKMFADYISKITM